MIPEISSPYDHVLAVLLTKSVTQFPSSLFTAMLKLSLWNFKKLGQIAEYLFLLKSVAFWWHILMISAVKGIW